MILGYHRVTADPGAFAVAPDTLRAHLDAVAATPGVQVVPLAETLVLSNGRGGTLVSITFDDAYEDTLEAAAPMLAERDFPATVFVPSRLVGAPSRMSTPQLRRLLAGGFEVGAHSRTHVDLRGCGRRELRDEVEGARRDLEDALGVEVRSFAYPFGAHDGRVRGAVVDSGYECAVTNRRAWVVAGADRMTLPRNVVFECSAAAFRCLLDGGLNYLRPFQELWQRSHRFGPAEPAPLPQGGE